MTLTKKTIMENIQVYHDQHEQYAENETITKLFLSTPHLSWWSDRNDQSHTFNEGIINVEWEVSFFITPTNVKWKGKVNKVYGEIWVKEYSGSREILSPKKKFDGRGFTIVQPDYWGDDEGFAISDVEIDMDKKEITFLTFNR